MEAAHGLKTAKAGEPDFAGRHGLLIRKDRKAEKTGEAAERPPLSRPPPAGAEPAPLSPHLCRRMTVPVTQE